MSNDGDSLDQETESLRREGNATAFVIASCALFIVGLVATQHFGTDLWSQEVFLRFAAAITVGIFAVAITRNLRSRIKNNKSQWWNIGQNGESPSWDDVLRMTLGRDDDDPIRFKRNKGVDSAILRASLGYFLVGCLLWESFTVLASGPLTPRLISATKPCCTKIANIQTLDLELNANLTALLALIAAAVSIYFTHRQLQAKVKADSRQAWIDKLRGNIAHFIALADAKFENRECGQLRRKRAREFNRCRIEMELMLNPSEKDHRLLSYLGLKLAFFGKGNDEFQRIEDVRNLEAAIRNDPCYTDRKDDWDKLIGGLPGVNASSAADRDTEFSDLIGYAIRLSHVVLKREWEMVKATR
jgi:hypothetical protein